MMLGRLSLRVCLQPGASKMFSGGGKCGGKWLVRGEGGVRLCPPHPKWVQPLAQEYASKRDAS
eukprot:208442-Chlamydomonas_euryale.AAC.1